MPVPGVQGLPRRVVDISHVKTATLSTQMLRKGGGHRPEQSELVTLGYGAIRRPPRVGEDLRKIRVVAANPASIDLLRSFKVCGSCINGGVADLVRVGGRYDGGYVMCRNTLENASRALSIGIRGADPWG